MIIHYEVAAILLLVTVLLNSYYTKRFPNISDQMFRLLMGVAIASSTLNIAGVYTILHAKEVSLLLNHILNSAYLLCMNALPVIYLLFLLSNVQQERNASVSKKILLLFPYAVSAVSIISSPITGFVYYFNRKYEYTHGPGIYLLYAIVLYYLLLTIALTIRYRESFTSVQRKAMYFFTFGNLAAVILQFLIPGLFISGFMVAVAVLLIHLSMQNPNDTMDKLTGVFNQDYFIKCVSYSMKKEHSFCVVCVEIGELKMIQEMFGQVSGTELLKEVADFLRSLNEDDYLFYLGDYQFAFLIDNEERSEKKLIARIHSRFREPFLINEAEVQLSTSICVLTYPGCVNTAEDVLDIIGFALLEAKQKDRNSVVYASEATLKQKHRESQIEYCIKNAIAQNLFEVYYQPIFSTTEKKFCTAEALVRLKDEELGYIPPDEFIPIAERNGSILKIGMLVFEKVCAFVSKNHLRELGVHYIEVNLSTVQCMQEHLAAELLQVMDEYNIPFDMINLEITETTAVQTYGLLMNNMQRLMLEGVTFSMDDYGTGFANMNYLINFPFRLVKIDKSIIWSFEKSKKAAYMLKHTIQMIKEMGMKIVAEGVETKKQAEELTEMGCEYLQGYYYAKPMSEKEYLQLLEQNV